MTKNPYIAGLVAGGVAALLYLSIATGSATGLLLFYIAPLPGFIAGFGWGVRAALVAALAGIILILASLGLNPAFAYAATLAIPSVIIAHYAFLYRLSDDLVEEQNGASEPHIEWYPLGRLILIVALCGGVLAMATILLLGSSYEAYLDRIGSQIDVMMSKMGETGFFKKPEELTQFKDLVHKILPALTAIIWCLFSLLNMWAAAHIVRLSGLLTRPWPDFSLLEYPQNASFALVALMVLSFIVPGLGGLILSGFAGALMMAFLLLGLAVVHYITRPYPARRLILFGTYVAVFFIGWGSIVLIIVGVMEPMIQLRKRMRSNPS